MISHKELKEILHYDLETGEWTWLVSPRNNVPVGTPAGSISDWGYRRIKIETVVYPSARLAFFYMNGRWPEEEMDHVNRIPDDDRWENLREANRDEQSQNRGLRSDNKSGFVGVFWRESNQKWCAKINGVHLGYFDTIEEAVDCRDRIAAQLHGDFANLNKRDVS